MAEKNYLIEFFNPVFFTLPRWADVAFAWHRPARARPACKTAHIGTTRPTPRSKRLRRCAFSDLCRSSAVNLPSGGGIGVRVLPASCVLVPKRDACAFLAAQEKPKRRPILVLFRRIFRFSFCTSHEIQHFCASDVVVATLVSM